MKMDVHFILDSRYLSATILKILCCIEENNSICSHSQMSQWPCIHDTCWYMMTSSNGNIFRVTGHLCGEFTSVRWIPRTTPVTRSFDVFFDLCLNRQLSKQSWGWWLKTLSRPLWRHFHDMTGCIVEIISLDIFNLRVLLFRRCEKNRTRADCVHNIFIPYNYHLLPYNYHLWINR